MGSGRLTRVTLLGVAVLLMVCLCSGCLFFPRKRTPASAGPGATGTIQGTVATYDGQPQAGVSITVFGSPAVAVSDLRGRFSFPSLPVGWQTIFARKAGALLAGQAVYVEAGKPVSLTLHYQLAAGHLHGNDARVPDKCGSCHVLHKEPMIKGGSGNSPCLGCHATWLPVGFSDAAIYGRTAHATQALLTGNPATEKGYCSNCHEPHGINNDHPGMLFSANAATSNPLCFACHATDPASGDYPGSGPADQPLNLHSHPVNTGLVYPVVNGKDIQAHPGECYNCHNPHGATQDNTLNGPLTSMMTRDEGDALCVRCHVTSAVSPYQGFRAGTKHTCTLCHNPHLVLRDAPGSTAYARSWKILMAPGDAARRTPHAASEYTVSHRGEVKLSNAYCLGCHNNTTAPNPVQSGPGVYRDWRATGFRDVRDALTQYAVANPADTRYRNLHAVHVDGPIGIGSGLGGTTVPGSGDASVCFVPGEHGYPVKAGGHNKVLCVDCHSVHGNATYGKFLRTDVFLRAPVKATRVVTSFGSQTGYAGKAGCGYGPADLRGSCHAGQADDNAALTGCNWCHSGSAGSPGRSCVCLNTCSQTSEWYGSGSGPPGTVWSGHGHSHADASAIRGGNQGKRRYVIYF